MNNQNNKMDERVFEGVQIIFKNFSGQKSQYNPLGARGFSVLIENENEAKELKKEGWNIKGLAEKDETGKKTDKITAWHLPCAIRYDKKPPKIYLITSNGKTLLDEQSIGMIDGSEILNVDLIVNPSRYSGATIGTGVKAYVKSMYVTIREDALMHKYGN